MRQFTLIDFKLLLFLVRKYKPKQKKFIYIIYTFMNAHEENKRRKKIKGI